LHTAVEVEAVDRLDQTDGGDLGEVVEPLAAVAETAGEVFDQGQVELHQLVPDALPARLVGAQLGQLREQHASTDPVGHGVFARGHGSSPFRHAGLAAPRRLRRMIAMRSAASVTASTSSASAVSTIQAKSSRLGAELPTVATSTRTCISCPVSSNSAVRTLPGTASPSSMAHASSTAIRRSSISSSVKSSRAASPAVAVRNTDR